MKVWRVSINTTDMKNINIGTWVIYMGISALHKFMIMRFIIVFMIIQGNV